MIKIGKPIFSSQGRGYIASGFFFVFLTACAPTRDPFGINLRQGRFPAPTENMRLRAELGIQLRNFKGPSSFSGRIYASADSAGESRFRLDIFGFPGQVAASWFYQEHHWTLLLHLKREVWEGKGETLSLPGMGEGDGELRLPEAQGIFGFLFGQPLVGFMDRDSLPPTWKGDTLHWSHHGTPWSARFDTTLGICREVFSSNLRIRYGHPKIKGNRVVPMQADIDVEGRPALSIQVSGLEDVGAWKTNPFVFSIPRGYQHHHRDPAGEQQ